MSGTVPVVRMEGFNTRDDTHGLNATTGWGTEDANFSQDVDTNFRLRVLVSDTVASTKTANYKTGLEFEINATGGFTAVTATTALQYANSAQYTDDDAVTSSQVTGGQNTFTNGTGSENNSAPTAGNTTLGNGNDHTEHEFCLYIDSAQVTDGDTIEVRATGLDATAAVTATITVVEAAAVEPPLGQLIVMH